MNEYFPVKTEIYWNLREIDHHRVKFVLDADFVLNIKLAMVYYPYSFTINIIILYY